MPQIEKIDALTIYTENLKELAAWYEGFGLESAAAFDNGQVGSLRMSAGALTLALIAPRMEVPITGHGAVVLTFQVSEFADFLEHVAALNIMPIEVQKNANGRFALFQDPDGNYVEIWNT